MMKRVFLLTRNILTLLFFSLLGYLVIVILSYKHDNESFSVLNIGQNIKFLCESIKGFNYLYKMIDDEIINFFIFISFSFATISLLFHFCN